MRSNATYLQIRPTPRLTATGWEVHVLDYSDFATEICVTSEYTALSVGPQLDDPGAGSISFDLDSPFWGRLLPNGQHPQYLRTHEHLFQCYQDDGILIFEFLGQSDEEDLLNDQGTRTVTISGPGTGQVLAWARVMPKGFPVPTPPQTDPNSVVGFWQFPVGVPAMSAYLQLLNAAKTRGTIAFVQPDFSETTDSGGSPWADITTPFLNRLVPYAPDMANDLLSQLNVATGQDLNTAWGVRCHWYMRPNFHLGVAPELGVHRENEVIFYDGQQLTKQRTRLRDEIANYICVRDDTGIFSIARDADSVASWRQREFFQTEGYLMDAARRDAAASTFLDQKRQQKESWSVTVPYDLPGRKPFVDFGIGDWIGLTTYEPTTGFSEGGPEAPTAYKVIAITVVVNAEHETPQVELTLQSALDDLQRRMAIQLTSILNTINSQTDPSPTLAGLPDVKIATPVAGDGLVYDPITGKWVNGAVNTGTLTPGALFIQATDPGTTAKIGDFWLQYPAP